MPATITEPTTLNDSPDLAELRKLAAEKEREYVESYLQLIDTFEELSQLILDQVKRAIDAAIQDSRVAFSRKWRQKARRLADQLMRHPWFIVNRECPEGYETLKQFYAEWAKCCTDHGRSLRDLTNNRGHHQPLAWASGSRMGS